MNAVFGEFTFDRLIDVAFQATISSEDIKKSNSQPKTSQAPLFSEANNASMIRILQIASSQP